MFEITDAVTISGFIDVTMPVWSGEVWVSLGIFEDGFAGDFFLGDRLGFLLRFGVLLLFLLSLDLLLLFDFGVLMPLRMLLYGPAWLPFSAKFGVDGVPSFLLCGGAWSCSASRSLLVWRTGAFSTLTLSRSNSKLLSETSSAPKVSRSTYIITGLLTFGEFKT